MHFQALAPAFLIACALAAQGAVPPPILSVTNPQPGLCSPNVPATDAARVHMTHLPGGARSYDIDTGR